ncbi:hypothetical protein BDV34DRAFT_105856 [Aspergillus parasiticus]|uniref:Uncharacterized protein n=1 Tax=Aspergillus parasiticus TaxID=5067 RepID=A0A5N6DIY4_ASPPA|nr:hypothetical protein BDV34DRAFT_105856 [Aspergillus parasiticus]
MASPDFGDRKPENCYFLCPEAQTGSLGLRGNLRVEEDLQSYTWGLAAHALLTEIAKRSWKWPELITVPIRVLLRRIEEWYFEQTDSARTRLQGRRITKWQHRPELLATVIHFVEDMVGYHRWLYLNNNF